MLSNLYRLSLLVINIICTNPSNFKRNGSLWERSWLTWTSRRSSHFKIKLTLIGMDSINQKERRSSLTSIRFSRCLRISRTLERVAVLKLRITIKRTSFPHSSAMFRRSRLEGKTRIYPQLLREDLPQTTQSTCSLWIISILSTMNLSYQPIESMTTFLTNVIHRCWLLEVT